MYVNISAPSISRLLQSPRLSVIELDGSRLGTLSLRTILLPIRVSCPPSLLMRSVRAHHKQCVIILLYVVQLFVYKLILYLYVCVLFCHSSEVVGLGCRRQDRYRHCYDTRRTSKVPFRGRSLCPCRLYNTV